MRTCIGPNESRGFVVDHDAYKNLLTPLRLFGLSLDARSAPAHRRGLAALFTSRGRLDSREWAVAREGAFTTFTWKVAGLRWVSSREFDLATCILVRKDPLTNTGADSVVIHREQARLTFAPTRYRAYTQESLWCHEFQDAWRDVPPGGVSLACEHGRANGNASPCLALSQGEGQPAVAFNLIPNGNWSIHLRTATVLGSLTFLCVEIGFADENLSLELAPEARSGYPRGNATRSSLRSMRKAKSRRSPVQAQSGWTTASASASACTEARSGCCAQLTNPRPNTFFSTHDHPPRSSPHRQRPPRSRLALGSRGRHGRGRRHCARHRAAHAGAPRAHVYPRREPRL